MARPTERMRLKDKIIDDLSKAIKAIQEHLYYISKDPSSDSSPTKRQLTLSNGDRLCHKLCDKLDHAFLHGLREVTHGYWRLVKTLSHKGMVREIDWLTNVTTDLGRGRAWLYASLNEGLLESYFRMLAENEKLVKKHYNKDALLLDSDRMNVLLTLTSGLDFVTFHLEFDLPYLDLSPSPPRTQSSCWEDVPAVEPMSSWRASAQLDQKTCPPSDSDSASVSSFDVQPVGDAHPSKTKPTPNIRGDPSPPMAGISNNGDAKEQPGCGSGWRSRSITPTETCASSNNYRNRTPSDSLSLSSHGSTCDLDRHQRFESIISADKDFVDEGEDSLEVIRIKKKKKKKTKSNLTSSDSVSHDSIKNSSVTDLTSKSRTHKGPDAVSQHIISNVYLSPAVGNANNVSCGNLEERKELSAADVNLPLLDSGIDINDIVTEAEVDGNAFQGSDSEKRQQEKNNDFLSDQQLSISREFNSIENKSFQSVIESKIAEMCNTKDTENGHNFVNSNLSASHVIQDFKELHINSVVTDSVNVLKNNTYVTPEVPVYGDNTSDSCTITKDDHSRSLYDTKDHCDTDRMKAESPSHDRENGSLPEGEQDNYYDVYSTSSSSTSESLHVKKDNTPVLTKLQEASYMQDYMDCVLKGSDMPDKEMMTAEQDTGPQDYALSLDNNIKLQVMLDIFKQEDETFIKMFACRENHTEGHFTVSFVLISDQYLYLLHYQPLNRKFIIQSVTKLTDIIFISTGLYEQTLNIESRDKSKQKQRLWLTPGHQELTKAIVQSLTEVVKQANASIVSVRSRFSVGSDVPLQKIGLRKYISKELHCEPQDVVINNYSLVFWEDPSSSDSAYSDPTTREGTLLLRTQDPIKGFIWKPVYMVLKGTMLSVANSRDDPSPHSYLGLGGDQCIGCRQTEVGERQHCVELVLAIGGSWYLSAATAGEILDWRRSLCLAVSRGVEEMGALSACIPCCCVQARSQLMLCHEDLDTKFFRTLGRAQLEDVTAISMDNDELPYCVVEFESQEVGVTSGKWVFHFSSVADMSRFTSSLAESWKEIFQVELPVLPLEDMSLQRHCQSHASLLAKAFELK